MVKQPLSRLKHLLNIYGKSPLESLQALQAFIELWRNLSQYSATAEEWDYAFTGSNPSGRLKPTVEAIIQAGLAMRAEGGLFMGTSPKSFLQEPSYATLAAKFDHIPPEAVKLILDRTAFTDSDSNSDPAGYFIPPSTGVYRLSTLPRRQGLPGDGIPSVTEALSTAIPIQLEKFNSLVGGRAYLVASPTLKGLVMSTVDTVTNIIIDTEIPTDCLFSSREYIFTSQAISLLSRYSTLFTKTKNPPEDVEYALDYCQLKPAAALDAGKIKVFLSYDLLKQQCISAQALAEVLHLKSYASAQAAAESLSDITGWTPQITSSLLIGLTSSGGVSSDAPIEITLELLTRLAPAYSNAVRIGLSEASRLFRWAQEDGSSQEAAEELRDVMRAQVDEKSWEAKAKALFDPLRHASRNALVAACVKLVPMAHNADGLFEHFLIDVSMGTCLKTSRLKQVISSIQIFVQRCLLGLEAPDVLPTEIDKQKWEWMSSYDLWQVNRRIFLYPENWLEPTLRDNKSSVFKAVEASVYQGSVTLNDAVEACVTGMLEVANLEVIGLRTGNTKDHVIARTRLSPHKFFYRTYTRRTGCWSPWESLLVDIPTIQLTRTWSDPPFFHTEFVKDMRTTRGRSEEQVNAYVAEYPSRPICSGSYLRLALFDGSDDRLLLFLPTLTPKTYFVPDNPLKDSNLVAGTKYYWEIGMSFSERKNGKWSPRQTATGVLSTHMSFIMGNNGPEENTERLFPFPRLRDTPVDQHLVREGSFNFVDSVDNRGRPTVSVYLEVLVTPYSVQNQNQNPDVTRMAVFVGEFVYDNGQMRAGDTPKSKKYNKEPEERLKRSDALIFQGTQTVLGTRGQRTRTLYGTKVSPYDCDTDDLVAEDRSPNPELTRWPTDTDDLWDQRRLWDCWASVRPEQPLTQTPGQAPISSPVTALSNNFADAFQNHVTRDQHRQVFEYFNKEKWLSEYPFYFGVGRQGLGIPDDPKKGWYHELHTPIALYNWVLCVHLPMLLASSFSSSQQLDEALDAVKLVFDPTTSLDGDKTRIWRFAPFRETAQVGILNAAAPSQHELEELEDHPFSPFVIARQRTAAYMRWFAYKYIEIMLAKGDMYFRRFTLESISLAIQCYVEASQVFGSRPQTIQSAGKRRPLTYASLLNPPQEGWGPDKTMKNALVSLETLSPFR